LRGEILFRIDTAPKSNLRSHKSSFKSTPIYSFKKGRKVSVGATHFMETATEETSKKIPDFFIKNGQYQLSKVWK